MKYQRIARTDKAEVYLLSDGTVLKRYLTPNALKRIQRDLRSLEYLDKNFGEIKLNGWTYRIVKVIRSTKTERAILLNFVEGVPLSKLPKAQIKLGEYHAGVWLGLYHERIFGLSSEGLMYTDYIPNNIMIDIERRCVTALDPGMLWGRVGPSYQDLLLHIHGTFGLVYQRPTRFPFFAFIHFLQGYQSVSKSSFHFRAYLKALCRELKTRSAHSLRISQLRQLTFIFGCALTSPIYLLFIPCYLTFLHRRS